MAASAEKFDFYVDVKSCVSGSCTTINAAPSGEYDYVGVTIALKAYPDTVLSTRLEVTAGLLDADEYAPNGDLNAAYKPPGEVLPADLDNTFRALAKVVAQVGGVQQLPTFPFISDSNRTVSIPLNRAITPVIRLSNVNLAGVDLRLGIGAGHMEFTPLQMVGQIGSPSSYIPFRNTVAKHYADLKPFMTHVPKVSAVI